MIVIPTPKTVVRFVRADSRWDRIINLNNMDNPASQKQIRYILSLLGYSPWNNNNAIESELAKLDKGSAGSIISNLVSEDLDSVNKQFHSCGIKSEIKEEKFLNPERIIKHIIINS